MDRLALMTLFVALLAAPHSASHDETPDAFFVDAVRGDDRAAGTRDKPLRTIGAAVERIPEPVERSVSILLASGKFTSADKKGASESSLRLARRMRPDVSVRILPQSADATPIFGWSGGDCMVDVSEGAWILERVQVGAGESGQRRGVVASGTGTIALSDVRLQLRSNSDFGILAQRGGRIRLRGAIRLNDPPPEGPESFSGIRAVDGGIVEFEERDKASLVLGNGNLTTSYWGSIRLGCETANITCATRSNCLSIGNSGRIDLRNTRTTLVALDPKNTPIGLEDDGHILAEDAHITIRGENDSAIALQKVSALFCNDIELEGKFGHALWASSRSTFVGAFTGDVGRLEASTGASIHIERVHGKVVGPFEAKSGGLISLPDKVITSK